MTPETPGGPAAMMLSPSSASSSSGFVSRLRPCGRCWGDVGEIVREGVSRRHPQYRLPAVAACDGEVAWVSVGGAE